MSADPDAGGRTMTGRRADRKPRLTWPDVTARRLRRQGLAEPFVDASPADVVAAMCGAHAQVLSAAELSIGVRLAGATRADVRHALWSERSLVKTFGPRGTVHLLPRIAAAVRLCSRASGRLAGPRGRHVVDDVGGPGEAQPGDALG